MDWFKIGKGIHQSCILSPYLFNLYVEYIMLNAGLDESLTRIKIDVKIYKLDLAKVEEPENKLLTSAG